MAQHWIDNALDTVERNMLAAGRQPLGYRANGKPIWPIFGAEDNPPPAPAPTPPAPTPPPAPEPAPDKGFPENTPLEQMKPEQREAYWKHQARKHEDRHRPFAGMTPEQLKELQDKAAKQDALELELGTTAEKAAAKAADEAKQATRGELLPDVINAKLDAAAARAGVTEDDLKAALEFVDTTKFLDAAGKVDADKVKAFVATVKPATGNGGRLGPSGAGAGRQHSQQTGSAAERGRAEAQRRFNKQKPA